MRLCIFGGPSTVLHNAKREFDFDGSYLYTYIHTYLDKWNKKKPRITYITMRLSGIHYVCEKPYGITAIRPIYLLDYLLSRYVSAM